MRLGEMIQDEVKTILGDVCSTDISMKIPASETISQKSFGPIGGIALSGIQTESLLSGLRRSSKRNNLVLGRVLSRSWRRYLERKGIVKGSVMLLTPWTRGLSKASLGDEIEDCTDVVACPDEWRVQLVRRAGW